MRIQLLSLVYFRNIKPFMIYFFVSPIIQMILFVLINQQYSNNINYSVALGSIFISANGSAINTINQLLVTDTVLDIHKEMIVHKPFSKKYWLDKVGAVYFSSFLLFLINTIILVILGLDFTQLFTAIILLPFSILYSFLLGSISFYLSINMSNIYFFNNIFINILPIISGLVISITTYPPVFQKISAIFPYGTLLQSIYSNQNNIFTVIIYIFILGLICITLYRYRVAHQIDKK